MGQIVVVASLKGGTGKTTVAVNLACALVEDGLKVTVIDVDPFGGAAAWAAEGRLPVEVIAEPPIDLHGQGRWSRHAGTLAQTHDVVVVDLPPLVVRTLSTGLMMADLVLIPLTPSPLDVGPTAEVLRQLTIARESRQRRPASLLIPNRVDHGVDYGEATKTAVESLQDRWGPVLREHLDFVSACAVGQWVGDFAPDGPAARDVRRLKTATLERLGRTSTEDR